MKREAKLKNDFHYRVSNVNTMRKLEEVMKLDKNPYSSYNELINHCVELSIDEILNMAKGKYEKLYNEHENKCDKLAHEVYLRAKQQDKKQSELLLEVLANQQILLSVFNMLLLSNKDKADMVQRGLLTDKPKYLLDFYKDLEE